MISSGLGKIASDGTLEKEAVEYRLPPLGVPLVAQDAYLLPADMADSNAETRADDKREANGAVKAFHERPMTRHDARPKLDLGGGSRNVGSKNGGKGNPQNPAGYPTAYLWENVFQKDSMMDILQKFISLKTSEDKKLLSNGQVQTAKKKMLLFPRYHQL
ncbi:MAG: hypothetical protein II014_00155, partial [Bifidobacteriaceae bacterium]|nr:hypothetical protein [Bifidobacteriaceae bacterium]